jgi:hypothetical protein
MQPPSSAAEALVRRLYEALGRRDAAAATACYAEEAHFEDIGFRLHGQRAIGRMWRFVCASDLSVEPGEIVSGPDGVRGHWLAIYPPLMASRSRKQDRRYYVRNATTSTFRFDDGLIIDQSDDCDPRRWAEMAFPFPISSVMGNLGFVRRLFARADLARYAWKHPD